MSVKFKRVVTGYRCHETNCYELGVWYVETEADFYHWCPKHAVSYMADADFWSEKFARRTIAGEYTERVMRPRRRRKTSRNVNL